MEMNKPHELSMSEWKEIMAMPAVREAWGIGERETPEQFAAMVYGMKFRFSPGMAPGYLGDLYILQGDALGEPMSLIRKNGDLALIG
jgi:hypothetical protein